MSGDAPPVTARIVSIVCATAGSAEVDELGGVEDRSLGEFRGAANPAEAEYELRSVKRRFDGARRRTSLFPPSLSCRGDRRRVIPL